MRDNLYKRILVINDDDTEEDFFKKYDNLYQYKDMILYCNDSEKAFECITSDNFCGCDKIILDIKIEWNIPDKYINDIKEYVDDFNMSNKNMGFLLFIYFISRGYPINRIAFLSAYITEKDSEYEVKKKLLNELEQNKPKKKDIMYEEELKKSLDKIPSLKKRILKILEQYPKGIKAYSEIENLLTQDIDTNQNTERKELESSSEAFFRQLANTGLKIKDENKINKNDKEKLQKWMVVEQSENLKKYYDFRAMVLTVCEGIEDKDLTIYKFYDKKDSRNNKDFQENYPKPYFKSLVTKIKDEIFEFREEKNVDKIAENIVSNLVAYWESINPKHIDIENKKESVNAHAITMVLKSTRNWYAHGRIDKLGIDFCKFIFLLSMGIIYGDNKVLKDYVQKELRLENDSIPENMTLKKEVKFYKKIWKGVNVKLVNAGRTSTYIVNVDDLYSKYSHENARNKIKKLPVHDLYEMFILCLHFPDVIISDEKDETFIINFNEIEYNEQDPFMFYLEKIALDNLDAIKQE